MKRALVLCLISAAVHAEPIALEVSHTYTNVQFTIYKWSVLKQEGTFKDSSGEVVLDPDDPTRSRVQLTVAVASIDTRSSGRDRVLRGEDFFDADRYPAMTFVSTGISRAGKDLFQVAGDLTIRGVTKHLTVPVRFFGMGSRPGAGTFAGFETDFTVDRTEFGVNGTRWSGGQLVLSKEVQVHLTVGAVRATAMRVAAP
jgi:polyisoprenoid-binding protein YceI